jgi:hypothetical protein
MDMVNVELYRHTRFLIHCTHHGEDTEAAADTTHDESGAGQTRAPSQQTSTDTTDTITL